MKKTLFLILIASFLLNLTTKAQGTRDTVKNALINGQKVVTGAAQDVLSNYLQVAAKNLFSNNSNLQLKLTWFALNSMDSVHKYNNDNYLRTWWQRNLEFQTAVGVDKSNNFNSLQAGVSYNFLNRRDIKMTFFTKTYIEPYSEEQTIINNTVLKYLPSVQDQLKTKLTPFFESLYGRGDMVTNLKSLISAAFPDILQGQSSDEVFLNYLQEQINTEVKNKANQTAMSATMGVRIDGFAFMEAGEIITGPLNTYVHSFGKTPLKYASYLTDVQATEMTQYIDQQVAANPVLQKLGVKTLTDLNNKVFENYQAMVNYIGRQPLLTFGYLYNYGKGTVLNSHQFGLTYLQGTGGFQTVKQGQIKASLTDTLTSTDLTGMQRNLNRNIIAFQAGYNQVLAMQKKVSVMELNIALEQDWATMGYVYQTSVSKFYFDAYFRARLPATPWIKFDLKYDPKDGNVFGFFDFTYNLDK